MNLTKKQRDKIETEDSITYNGDLILEEDLKIKKNLIVKGRIFGKEGNRYNITALNINAWDITALNINAWDINAANITAWNITALNINAWDITALNINAWDINAANITAWNINALNITAGNIILCNKIKVKKGCKVICKQLIINRFSLKRKEWKV